MSVSYKFLRRGLIHSTAIVAAALVVGPAERAQAQTLIIGSSTRTSAVNFNSSTTTALQVNGSGQISVGSSGAGVIVSNTTGKFITNNGAIKVTTSSGLLAVGIIVISSGGLTGALTNTGTVTANYTDTTTTSATAIAVGVANAGGFIGSFSNTNTGTIGGTAIASATSSSNAGGAFAGAGGVNVVGGIISSSFTNNGTIYGSARSTLSASGAGTFSTSGAYAAGVLFGSSSVLTGAFKNTGDIFATANADGSNQEACAMGLEGNNSNFSSITNDIDGVIKAEATSTAYGDMVKVLLEPAEAMAAGVWFEGNNNVSGLFSNNGMITATATTIYNYALDIDDVAVVAVEPALLSYSEAEAFGLYLGDGASLSAGFTTSNTGTVSATAHSYDGISGEALAGGVYVGNGATINGVFENSGDILATADADGTNQEAYAVGIWGASGLHGAGATIDSFDLVTNSFDTIINNDGGTISATATATAYGAVGGPGLLAEAWAAGVSLTNGGGASSLFTNEGDITGSATTLYNLLEAEDLAVGASSIAYGDAVSYSQATAYGLHLEGNATLSGGFTNSNTGTLSATAHSSGGLSDNALAAGVYLVNGADIQGTGGLINAGTISGSATADNGQAIGAGIMVVSGDNIFSGTDISCGVHNDGGTISGTASGHTALKYGIYVSNASISGGISNNGGIISGGTGIKPVIVEDGDFAAPSVYNQISGAAIYMNFLTIDTPIILNGGRVIGDIVDDRYYYLMGPSDYRSIVRVTDDFYTEGNFYVSEIGVFDNAKFTISAGDTVTAGKMTGTLEELGGLLSKSDIGGSEGLGGTYDFEIDSSDPDGGFGKLAVAYETPRGIDLTNASVSAKVRLGNISDGDKLRVGTGGLALIGTDGTLNQLATVIPDNSHLWSFKMADGSQAIVTGAINPVDFTSDNTELWLIVEQDNFVNNSATTGNAGIGNVIPELNGDPDPVVQQILIALNSAPTVAALNDVLEALQADHSMGTVMGSLGITSTVNALLSTELSQLRTGNGVSGMSAGDRRNTSDGLRVWGQGFGTAAEQSVREGISGYDSNTFGLAFGVDTAHIPNTVLGLAISYANTDVDSDSTNKAHTEINSYQITAYGSHYYARPDIFVNGMLAYSHHKNDTSRFPLPGLKANGDFTAKQYSATLAVGRDYRRGDMMLTPQGSLNWSHYNPDDYTERGAGAANLTVKGKKVALFELGVGLDATWFMGSGDLHIDPTISVGYSYDVIGDNMEMVSSLQAGGASFKTEGFDPAQHKFNVGFGVNIYSNAVWEFKAEYDYNVKSDFHSHFGLLRVGYNF